MSPTSDPPAFRPLALAAVAATAILAGAVLGGLTNAANGRVSPTYFVEVLGWDDVADVGRAAIAQGIFEGLLYGTVFALVFTVVAGVASRGALGYVRGLRYVLGMLAAAAVTWGLGGLAGLGLATLSPEFFRETFRGVPEETGEMLRYAWVGGSIWGATLGGLVAVVLGSVLFAVRWRREQASR